MTREEARAKAQELVSKMTLEEKASQIRYDAPAIERLGIPAYNWWGEGLHGVARAGNATMFPQAIGMAATFDPDLLYKVGTVISTEARAKYNSYSKHDDRGIYKCLTLWSPNVNLFRDPRWGRGHETYGEDPYLTGELGKSFVKGMQGDGEYLRVSACAKHFAVHSGPEADRHHFNAVVNKKDLYETYLPAFEKCVKEAKVESVMGAYNRTNDEPCCGSKLLMEDILRGEWGFEGHFVSDCWAIRDFFEEEGHHVCETPMEAAALALSKGCDVNCGNTYQSMMKAYDEGLVTEEMITQAAVRLFTTRYLLGMFDENEYDRIPYSVVECKEHRKLANTMAQKSIVLLKNDNVLPLDLSQLSAIGVVGPNANSRRALMGNYHGTASKYVTVLDGIMNAAGDDVRVFASEGSHLFMDRIENLAVSNDRIAEAVTVAENSDVVILCLGLDETLEGEQGDTGNSYASGDKPNLLLPESQIALMEAIEAVGKPVILLNMTGSAMDLSFAKNSKNIKGILQVWYPGAEGGEAVADILFGKISPSGKLPITFYNSTDELPPFTDYDMKGRTYRYMEHPAQYPFGYGLTYADTQVAAAVVDASALSDKVKNADLYSDSFEVKVSLENLSDIETDEVVQVYIKNNTSKYAVRNVSLCGIARTTLPGKSKKDVVVTVPTRALLVVNDDGQYVLDGTDFTMYVGFSQPDEVSCDLMGQKPVEIALSL